jgi:hypothetical protein
MQVEYDADSPASIAEKFINHTQKNIFLTGKAGTGKTTFLKNLSRNTHKKILITAPTGIAALNAGGVTLHSQFQLPMGGFIPDRNANFVANEYVKFETAQTLFRHMRMSEIKRKTIREAELLVIDEVSMLRADLLDAINLTLQFIRRNRSPFGGLQVLFIGDMLQLPPVIKNEEWSVLQQYYHSPYFFDAQVLKENPPVYIELEKIYRQTDLEFMHLLNNLRYNRLDEDDIDVLNKYYKPNFQPESDEEYITLTTHNKVAEKINSEALAAIIAPIKAYYASVESDFPESMYPCERELLLKKGAQVMFIKNDISGAQRYFNGKIGKVELLDDEQILVRLDNGLLVPVEKHTWNNIRYKVNEATKEIEEEILGSFEQYPIKLAWAITIHKSQGLTFDKAIIDVRNVFASGQAYVALSRLRSLEGLVLPSPFPRYGIGSDESIIRFSETKDQQGDPQEILEEASIEFIQEFSKQTFSFKDSLQEWNAHLGTYQKEEQNSVKQKHLAWARTMRDKVKTRIDTGMKFIQQLEKIFVQNPISLQFLRERLSKAAEYFVPLLESEISELLIHKKKMSQIKRTKAYVTELEDLDTLMMHSYINVKKTVFMAESLEKSVPFDNVLWEQQNNNSWRIMALQQVKDDISKHEEDEFADKFIQKFSPKLKKEPKEKKPPKEKGATYKETLQLIQEGLDAAEIATKRGFSKTTIEGHFAQLITEGLLDIESVMDEETIEILSELIADHPDATLKEIIELTENAFSYGQVRMVMASMGGEI